MLGRPAGGLALNLVELNFARESCPSHFVATTALRGAHCGVGGRSLWRWWLHCKAAEAAEVASQLAAGLGDGSACAGHLENGGGAAAAAGGGGR